LARNFLKGSTGDLINVLMAAMAWNLNLWMRTFFAFIFTLYTGRPDRYRSILSLPNCLGRVKIA